jgi:Protein of unknown function (DUF4232)
VNDVDDEVRDLLRDKAHEIPPHLDLPRSLTPRVRRRIALNALAVTATLVVIAAGAFVTLRAFRSQPSETYAGATRCTSADLRAIVSMEGAAGSREGTIELTNTADTCTLTGTPTLELLDRHMDPIVSGIAFVSVPAGWEVGGSPQPPGWPVVTLARDDSASVRVRWSNWCAEGNTTPHWRIAIPGSGDVDVEGLDATTVPPCNGPDLPSTIEVGPFEPHDDP